MPKSKKPAGGRAQNFEPRYGEKTPYQDAKRRPGQASAGKTGSKSPSHRGYRPAEAAGEGPKRRWSAQERAGRDESRGIRNQSDSRRDDRPARSYDDRPARSFDNNRGERQPRDDRRTFGDARPSYRPQGGAGRPYGDRPPRDDNRGGERRTYGDRPNRPYNDRPQRDDNRGPRRDFNDERPARREFNNDRPQRSFNNDRPQRSFDDRAPRREGERPSRPYNDRPARDERPARDDRAPRREYNADRPAPQDRAPRREFNSDRPARPGRGDRAPRRDFNPERPERREYNSDRPRAARPRRDETPNRADWSAKPKSHDAQIDVVHERLQADAIQATDSEVSFADLGIGQNIVKVLDELGAKAPFPIQAATIGPILEGKDVLARGRTGSGKTIAFGAPLVESILKSQAGIRREFGRKPKALIMAPTRELALQIDRTVQALARSVGLFTTQIYGGVPQARQVGALQKGVDIIIGTPGRIEDLQAQGKLDLREVQMVVLDEADHMSELGFLEPMQRILRLVKPGAQKLMFSATLDREVAALVDEFLVDPAVYEVAGEDQDSSTIDHRILVIDHRDKAVILDELVDRDGKTLVFARTRAYAEMLAEQFTDAGIAAVALHGDLNQAKRTRNLQRLTDGKVNVLVATDVAARGIHVDDIDLVVQADAPDEYKTYLHRSGRTGRAGRAGTVVTLVTRQRRRKMTEMLDRAEIDAPFDDARPGDDIIVELRGA